MSQEMPVDPVPLADLSQAQSSFVLGVIGAALLRDWYSGGPDQAARLAELAAAVRIVRPDGGDQTVPSELSVHDGYTEWAVTYDGPNPLIQAEESFIRALLEPFLQPGMKTLDAACGTGRHTAWLRSQGCTTVGVDLTPAMLSHASAQMPHAAFVQGDLSALPLSSRSVDAAICALALCHLPDMKPALRELSRVIRPGGRLLISDPHGRGAFAGGQGFYGPGGIARPRFVRNYHRQASEWITAFVGCGFEIDACYEPRLDAELAAAHPVSAYFPEAAAAAFIGLPFLWIWSVVLRAT